MLPLSNGCGDSETIERLDKIKKCYESATSNGEKTNLGACIHAQEAKNQKTGEKEQNQNKKEGDVFLNGSRSAATIFSESFMRTIPDDSHASFTFRGIIGTPTCDTVCVRRNVVALSICPFEDPLCRVPLQCTRYWIGLCDRCYERDFNSLISMRFGIDEYVDKGLYSKPMVRTDRNIYKNSNGVDKTGRMKGDWETQMGILDTHISHDVSGLGELNGTIHGLASRFERPIEITHRLAEDSIPKPISEGHFTMSHSLDETVRNLLSSVNVNHNLPQLNPYHALGPEGKKLAEWFYLSLVGFVAYKAYSTRNKMWIGLLVYLIFNDIYSGLYDDVPVCVTARVKATLEKFMDVPKLMVQEHGVWVTQADTRDMFANGIMTYMYVKVISKLGTDITLEEFLKKTVNFDRYGKSINFGVDMIMDLLQGGLTAMCDWLKVEEIRLKADPCPEATEWLKEARNLLQTYERTMELDWGLFNRVTDLRKRGTSLMAGLERKPKLDKIYLVVNEVMHDLHKVLGKLQRASIVAAGPRIEPLGVMMVGCPGVGKSTSSHNMMLAVTAAIIEKADMDRFEQNECDFIYSRKPEEEYFTGYHGQTVFAFDDIGQLTDVAGVTNSPFMEAISAINSAPYLLHMAALEDKGTVAFSSKLVWATSNRITYSKDVSSLYSPQAFMRRWNAYWCCPRVEYAINKESDPRKRLLDTSLVDLTSETYPHLEWYHYDLATGEVSGTPLTYRQTYTEIIRMYKMKYDFGKRLLLSNQKTKIRAILEREIADGKTPDWSTQGGDIDDLIEQEISKRLNGSTLKEEKKLDIIPDDVERSKRWLFKYMKNHWPETSNDTISHWVRTFDVNKDDIWDSDDPVGSLRGFEILVRQHVFDISEKKSRNKFLKRFESSYASLTDWYNDQNVDKRKTLKMAAMALTGVGTIFGMIRMFSSFINLSDDGSGDEECVHAQSFSQRVHNKTRSYVKPLKPKNRGKGHVQRVKGKGYQFDYDLDAQIGMDKQAMDILYKVSTRSQYKVASKHSNCYGYVTMLDGLIGMAPKHFMCEWRKKQELETEIDSKSKFMLSFSRRGTPLATKEVPFDEIEWFDPEDMADRDIVFFKMPKYFDPGPRILDHFVLEPDLPRDKFDGAIYLERERMNIVPILQMVREKGFTYDCTRQGGEYWENPDALTYQFPCQKGDCGSWIAITDKTSGCRKLIGIHVAGRSGTAYSAGLVVTGDEIKFIVDQIKEISKGDYIEDTYEPQVGEDVMEVEPTEQFTSLETAEPLRTASETAMVLSDLADYLPSQGVGPALLKRKVEPDGTIIDPWTNARVKYNLPVKYVAPLPLRMACMSYVCNIFRYSNDSYEDSFKLYSFEKAVEGIEGCPYFNGLPRSTSSGYPWCLTVPKGHKGKSHFFGKEGPYEFSSPACAVLRERVGHIVTKAGQGKRLKHIYADFLKDERRPLDKVITGKTRLISGAPLDYTIAVRMYFGDFCRWYLQNNVVNGSAVGVNVYGPDWTRVVYHLGASKDKRTLIAGDFKGYDGCLSRAIQLEFLELVEAYYDKGPTKYWQDDEGFSIDVLNQRLVRRVLFEDIMNSKHIVDKTVYEWTSSMPSGNPLTTVLNTFCNNVILRYACMLCYSKSLGSKHPYPVLSIEQQRDFMEKFEKNVRVIAYGDDNVLSIGVELQDVIDQKKLSEALDCMGFTYVDESKEGKDYTFRTLDEITFLKRSFVKEPNEDLYVAPLELATVNEIARWTKKKDKNNEILRDNIDTALRELSLHKESDWDKYGKRILTAARDQLAYVPSVTDYGILRALTRSSEVLLI